MKLYGICWKSKCDNAAMMDFYCMASKVMPHSCSGQNVASFLMPRIGDGKSAVMIAGGLNDGGNSAVMVDARVDRRQNAVAVFSKWQI